MAQEFFDALMKIAEIGNKINNTIRIGIAEEDLYLGFMSEHVTPPVETFAKQIDFKRTEILFKS